MAILWDVSLACLAKGLANTTLEATGSGFPEMKAMLFGKIILNYLSLRVLVVKLVSLSLGIAAGLPLGKDGPNVHVAACLVRLLNPRFFDKYVSSGPHGAGSSDVGSTVSKLLLAACAMGFACTFSAPMGGVIFALELMLPQTYDVVAYWGCFTAAVVGSITYSLEKSLLGSSNFLPLVSSNVLPGEGDSTEFPVLELVTYIILGILCGFAGGLFVRSHSFIVWKLRNWVPLIQSWIFRWPSFNGQRLDLMMVALLAMTNTFLASLLPLLGGQPQPLLIFKIFDKNLLDQEGWILPSVGVSGTLLLCFLMKWSTTLWALSCDLPAGIVAPIIILGALVGRIYVQLLPEWWLDVLISGSQNRGALMARFAIIGASAFGAAVCRTFALAITVFELLTLPNSILPLCASALVAIFVADQISLPFFDATLAAEELGGIPAMATDEALWPVMKVMERMELDAALPQVVTLRHLLKQVTMRDEDFFPILRPLDWTNSHEALLVGCMTRGQAVQLLTTLDPYGTTPRREVDLMSSEFQAPRDGSEPLVDGNPLRISSEHTVKDAYLLMKMAKTGVIYVTDRGVLKGRVTLGTLLCRAKFLAKEARGAEEFADEYLFANSEGLVPAELWDSDCGRILHALLQSEHFKDFWGVTRIKGTRRGQTKLLDLWLELRHAWVDCVDDGMDLTAATGLHELFRSQASREVQQQYLDLYKQLDNFITFLSMVVQYRKLANVAGDAAMYHLRSTLHHLLQEIEMSVANALTLVHQQATTSYPPAMPGIPLFHRIESDTLFVLTCDLVVFCNLVYIGVEVDFGSNESLAEPFFWCRVGFLIWCGIEFTIRVLGAGADFFNRRNLCEMIFVTCAALDVILFEKPGWLWRFSGLRSWRMLRVYQFARTSTRLKELSLVLDSMIRSSTALIYLALVMGGVYWSAGAWSRGILEANGTLEPWS
eukprot:symbB.v1.2.035030.t1/scaffold4634.1/size37086/2